MPTEGPLRPTQHEYWNELAGPLWVDQQERMDRLLEPLGTEVLNRAQPRPGERVLDIGCGCGQTTLALAERVGADGLALGIDISQVMLARAVERSAGSGARFRLADAESDAFAEGPFDVLYSRFGVMFFADPVQAFTNLCRAVRPGGRLAFICWRAAAENPLFHLPTQVAGEFVPLPEPTPPGLPGPFSLAPPGRAAGLLAEAGWRDIAVEPRDVGMSLGGSALTAHFMLRVGPIAAALAEAPPDTRERVAERLATLLEERSEDGRVILSARCWLVSAQGP